MEITEILNQNFTHLSDDYRAFAIKKDACRKCSIYDSYHHVGQSEGNAKNPIFMFVGEALGADEVSQGRPFIGRAGQRLREELRKYPNTFNKNNTIITNTVCCRPENNKFPRDTDGPWEIRSDNKRLKTVHKAHLVVKNCVDNWLYKEIEMLKPKVIVSLGSQSLEWVREQRGITNCRGNWLFMDRFRAWTFATFHPSYVLRCANSTTQQHVEVDFESDIKKIHDTWNQMIDGDDRMSMTDTEWRQFQKITFDANRHLVQDKPIDPSDPIVQYWNSL